MPNVTGMHHPDSFDNNTFVIMFQKWDSTQLHKSQESGIQAFKLECIHLFKYLRLVYAAQGSCKVGHRHAVTLSVSAPIYFTFIHLSMDHRFIIPLIFVQSFIIKPLGIRTQAVWYRHVNFALSTISMGDASDNQRDHLRFWDQDGSVHLIANCPVQWSQAINFYFYFYSSISRPQVLFDLNCSKWTNVSITFL